MKIWVTKGTPVNYGVRGAENCHFWFNKPHFQNSIIYCPISGFLDDHKITQADWRDAYHHSRVSLKFLQKTQNPLFFKIWSDICATYQDGVTRENVLELSMAYENEWYKMAGCNPFQASAKGEEKVGRGYDALTHYKIDCSQRYAESKIEKTGQSWREWIAEYEIDMSLSK
tara:strand:- start:2768 stop:3280 length:513 start_codon:yes stop_codon:yes gene_type:complete